VCHCRMTAPPSFWYWRAKSEAGSRGRTETETWAGGLRRGCVALRLSWKGARGYTATG
jgi:hypothetical protein